MPTHREWINDIMSDEQYNEEQKLLKKRKDGSYDMIPYPDKYRQEYDDIAYSIFSEAGATVTKCCVELKITKATFGRWVKRHPSFKIAVATGGLIGEDAFRDKIQIAAFQPSKDVNNRLIEMIARNVYNISVEDSPQISITVEGNGVIKGEESAKIYAEAMDRKEEYDFEIEAESVETVIEPQIKQIN